MGDGGLSLITDVIEGPGSAQWCKSGKERRLEPACVPPRRAQPTAGRAPDSDLLARARGAAALGALPPPIKGHRRQAHGLPQEYEQLLQEGLPQELYIGVPEGESALPGSLQADGQKDRGTLVSSSTDWEARQWALVLCRLWQGWGVRCSELLYQESFWGGCFPFLLMYSVPVPSWLFSPVDIAGGTHEAGGVRVVP